MRVRRRTPHPEDRAWTAVGCDESEVLKDLADCAEDSPDGVRIVARYLVLRVVLRPATAGADERTRVGVPVSEYVMVARGRLFAAEATALLKVLRLVDKERPIELSRALLNAASHAVRQRHRAGAFAYYTTAYRIAVDAAAPEEAALAATALARLADARNVSWAARVWHRRAIVLERRAQRARSAGAGLEGPGQAGLSKPERPGPSDPGGTPPFAPDGLPARRLTDGAADSHA